MPFFPGPGLGVRILGEVTKAKEAELAPLVDELLIKHGAALSLSVEFRLVMAVGSLVAGKKILFVTLPGAFTPT